MGKQRNFDVKTNKIIVMIVEICQNCGAKVLLRVNEGEHSKKCANCGNLVYRYDYLHRSRIPTKGQTQKLLDSLDVDFDKDNEKLFNHLFYWKDEGNQRYALYYREWHTYLGNLAPSFEFLGDVEDFDDIDYDDYGEEENQQFYYTNKNLYTILEFECLYRKDDPVDKLRIPVHFPIKEFVVLDFYRTSDLSWYLKDNQLVMRISNNKEDWDKHNEIIQNKVEDIIAEREYEEELKFREEVEREKEIIRAKNRQKEARKKAMDELIESGEVFPQSGRPPIPRDLVDAIWRRDGGKCVYCGSTENLQIDHIIPFSRGGATSMENLQILCQKCNCQKSNNIG